MSTNHDADAQEPSLPADLGLAHASDADQVAATATGEPGPAEKAQQFFKDLVDSVGEGASNFWFL